MIDGLHPWYIEVLEFMVNSVKFYGPYALGVGIVAWTAIKRILS